MWGCIFDEKEIIGRRLWVLPPKPKKNYLPKSAESTKLSFKFLSHFMADIRPFLCIAYFSLGSLQLLSTNLKISCKGVRRGSGYSGGSYNHGGSHLSSDVIWFPGGWCRIGHLPAFGAPFHIRGRLG